MREEFIRHLTVEWFVKSYEKGEISGDKEIRIVNMIDTTQIKLDIQKAKKDGSNFIITTIHWGNEYQRKESSEQSKLAQWMADQGVDAIIGMHPHVVQPMKIIHPKNNPSKSVPVAYSLGNFVSNQRER